MKTKQIIGIVVAAVMFILVCSTSALVNSFTVKSTESFKDTMKDVLEDSSSYTLPTKDFMGVVSVSGTIQGETSSSFFETAGYDHDFSMDYVDDLMDNEKNKGIILLLNSPGGSVYETDEMYLKLMEYKEKTGRPVYAYMENQACSGAYYMAMAADKVYANRNCMTGSIGVIMSLMNCSELYDKLGIKEIDITSGKNKAMGSSGQEMTQEQKDILQSMIDEAYEQFVGIVADGRHMDVNTVKKLADGRIYTAKQAKENGLIDEVASYDEFIKFVNNGSEKELVIHNPSDEKSNGFFTSFFSKAKLIQPKSESQVLVELLDKKENGGLLYYAK